MNLKSLIPVRREQNDVRMFNPFLSLQREVEDVFENFTRDWPTFRSAGLTTDLVPNTDVVENDKEIQITAELPGLEDKDVQINLADNVLTIKGEKKAEKEEKTKIIVSSSVAMARSPGPSSCRQASTRAPSRRVFRRASSPSSFRSQRRHRPRKSRSNPPLNLTCEKNTVLS